MTLRKEEVTREVVEDVKAKAPIPLNVHVHESDILYFKEKIAYEKSKGGDTSKYEEQLRVLRETLRKKPTFYAFQLCLVDDDNNRVAEHTLQTSKDKNSVDETMSLHGLDIKEEIKKLLVNEIQHALIEQKQLTVAVESLIDQAFLDNIMNIKKLNAEVLGKLNELPIVVDDEIDDESSTETFKHTWKFNEPIDTLAEPISHEVVTVIMNNIANVAINHGKIDTIDIFNLFNQQQQASPPSFVGGRFKKIVDNIITDDIDDNNSMFATPMLLSIIQSTGGYGCEALSPLSLGNIIDSHHLLKDGIKIPIFTTLFDEPVECILIKNGDIKIGFNFDNKNRDELELEMNIMVSGNIKVFIKPTKQ